MTDGTLSVGDRLGRVEGSVAKLGDGLTEHEKECAKRNVANEFRFSAGDRRMKRIEAMIIGLFVLAMGEHTGLLEIVKAFILP